jgi:hypothetical protein
MDLAASTIEEALTQADPKAKPSTVLSRLNIVLTSVSATAHDESIDKWTCSAELRVKLPPEIVEIREHPVFKAVASPKPDMKFLGDELVSPVAYTVYQSREKRELILSAEGLDVPAKYLQGAYRVGAFASDLRTAPDLRTGLALYNARAKHLLIQPTDDGKLRFHFTYDNPACRGWMQHITEERGDTLIYDNPAVACSVIFSVLGELILVQHKGCNLIVENCLPDGIYRRQ